MKQRYPYILLTFLLLSIEVIIALYVHDDFIRPYIGDILVVILLYMLIRICFPKGIRLLPLYIFLFSILTEWLQYIQIVKLLGLSDVTFFRVLIGSTFDWKDIICYGIGCFFCFIIPLTYHQIHKNEASH